LRQHRFLGGRSPLTGALKSLLPLAIAAAVGAAAAAPAGAQDAWQFNNEIACATAPVFGVPFSRCWTSNVRTFRIGNVQSWRLTYTDSKSDFAIGYYRLVEAHGVGGLSPVSNSSAIEWLRTADALKNVTTGASNWALSGSRGGDHYVTFQKSSRQCVGFVRNGSGGARQLNWILGAVFCREATAPLQASEAQFIADAVQVRE